MEEKPPMPIKGVIYALLAAVLFGITTPAAKHMLTEISPTLLAGLFYLGSGAGLLIYNMSNSRAAITVPKAAVQKRDIQWLLGAIVCGGIAAPLLLMYGLTSTTSSSASLFLNLESVFTSLLAWFVFRENFDRRILAGMFVIVLGGVILAWQPGQALIFSPGLTLIAAACLGWALDNNCTGRIVGIEPSCIASYKGLVAGVVNTSIALALGAAVPPAPDIFAALIIGLTGYGVSLVLFIHALRYIGAARTGAYFAAAPFVGTALSIALLGEALNMQIAIAALLMGLGLWLHLTEHHAHEHQHQALEHSHAHTHDSHHQHEHEQHFDGEEHTHWHRHEPIVHAHPHYPDMHHNHQH